MPGILSTFLYGAHLVAALIASGHALLFHPRARGAALWVGIVWLVPWVGPILYLALGINRIPRRARRTLDTGYGIAPRSEAKEGNRIDALLGGDQAYPAMLAAIDAAETSIDLQTYIFDNDHIGTSFADALGRAAKRGVAARVLVDAVGARYSRPSIVGPLRERGVSVALFLPTNVPWRWSYANLRNHRKLMVVDRRHGFVGGMNIRDACMSSSEPPKPTLDVHFRVEGSIVCELERVFRGDWAFANPGHHEPSPLPPTAPPMPGTTRARLVQGGPDRSDESIRWLKLGTLVRAERRVRIMTPYFVPDEDVVTALCAAATAGVEVQIILPGINNLRVVAWASRACWPKLLERGIQIFSTPPPFEHTKLMLVDDDVALVGSANWDERSFRLNFEVDLECQDPALVKQLDAYVDRRLEGAASASIEPVTAWAIPARLRDRIAWLGLPYL